MRLNLPRYNCTHLTVSSEFTVPSENGRDVDSFMNNIETHSHDSPANKRRAVHFGSKSRVGNVTHKFRGSLFRSVDNADSYSIRILVESVKATDNLPRPPAEFKPVSTLIEAIPHLFGPIRVNCDVIFSYDDVQNYISRISLPAPLMIQENSKFGATHIERIQFSRRTSDEVEYRVSLSKPENSPSFIHAVNFKSTIDLNQKSMVNLVKKAQLISFQLMLPPRGD